MSKYKLIFLLIILFLLVINLPPVKRYIKKQSNIALVVMAKYRYALEGIDN